MPVAPAIRVASSETTFRPVGSPSPRATSFDEAVHTCKAGDSYESVSKGKYGTDAYAAALRLYNRNHWQASAGIKRDGQIVPGEKVYLPPVAILEQRHGDLIRLAPRPTAPAAPGGPVPGKP